MPELAALRVRDGVAIITIDRPPVNALDDGTAASIVRELTAAADDPAVTAIVLTGAHGTFCAGADMTAFPRTPPRSPTLDVIAAIDASPKPIVAALAGNALGGGLEIAIACDYRIAAADARLALPEILRGLIPGAGGTQRLPRMIGVGPSLALILSGDAVSPQDALAWGLIDAIAADDVRDAAWAFALEHAGERRRIGTAVARLDDAALDTARRSAAPPERGGLAARAAIDAIQDATRLPLADGLVRERERFVGLLASEQAQARMHVFFAEREAGRIPGSREAAAGIAHVAIVGSGTMGRGIAATFADAEMAVTLIDVRDDLVAAARERIAAGYERGIARGRCTTAQRDERLARIATATSLDAAAHADLVVEAVYEDAALKRDIFRALDGIAAPHAILATNTSTLDIDALAAVTSRPQAVVGLHFFSPANAMRLVEIVRGSATSPQTIALAAGVAKRLGKTGVVSGNGEGFIGNRMLHGYLREADFLLEEGATPAQVDRVLRAFGFAMGPFAMSDLAGLDVGWRIRTGKAAIAAPAGRSPRIGDALCEAGRFGQKSGAGYYRYRDGERTPISDPHVDELAERLARIGGIERRFVRDTEILERCLYPLVNEAAAILADGIAERPGDIDVVWVNGYGFPAFRGGPLRWADSVGLATIVASLEGYARTHGDAWTPAPLLRELAAAGATFGDWTRADA